MFYDLARAQRGTCAICRMNAGLWVIGRYPDDEADGDGEQIEACARCIVAGMLDGLAPR